jgi:long-chain acyl-CoA synthetase
VRRAHVAERYASLVHALYSDASHCAIETRVQFEDGRVGMVHADVRIEDVPVQPERVAA